MRMIRGIYYYEYPRPETRGYSSYVFLLIYKPIHIVYLELQLMICFFSVDRDNLFLSWPQIKGIVIRLVA